MNILKPIIVNIAIFLYFILIMFHLFNKQGIIFNTIYFYKKIKKIKYHESKLDNKIGYLNNLINNYKNKNKDVVSLLMYLRFKKLIKNYIIFDVNNG